MRRPRVIAGAIVIGIIFLILAIPYWWMHSPIGKKNGIIITGEIYMLTSDRLEFVPMFYEYQSGKKSLRRAKEGGETGLHGGMDASRLLPLPPRQSSMKISASVKECMSPAKPATPTATCGFT